MAGRIPRWADQKVSEELPSILEDGEGNKFEFKEDFPQQAHDLAKELAAFGTSGGGRLFLGINDNCEVVGIRASDGKERDALIQRVRGIISRVRPEPTARTGFAVSAKNCVLFVDVSHQSEPVFYYDGRPYIRDLDESRPATPEEVKERVWAHPSSEFRRQEEQIELEKKQILLRRDQEHQKVMSDIQQAQLDAVRSSRDR